MINNENVRKMRIAVGRASTDLLRDFSRLFRVTLGVNLRYVGSRMAKNHLGGFEPELLADRCGCGVTHLIGRPALCGLPSLQFLQLLGG